MHRDNFCRGSRIDKIIYYGHGGRVAGGAYAKNGGSARLPTDFGSSGIRVTHRLAKLSTTYPREFRNCTAYYHQSTSMCNFDPASPSSRDSRSSQQSSSSTTLSIMVRVINGGCYSWHRAREVTSGGEVLLSATQRARICL